MPNSNFIPVKRLAGTLIVSQKRNNLGCTLTTREFVFQKPHMSYHILLDDVIGLIPYPVKPARLPKNLASEEWIHPRHSNQYYKITVRELQVINRQGLFTRGATDIIIPLNDRFIQHLKKHTDFTVLPI